MKRDTAILIVILIIILAGIFWFFKIRHAPEQVSESYPVHHKGGPCPGETQTIVMGDGFMKGIIDPGAPIKVIMNYYDCNQPKIGDVVYYSLSPDLPPAVRRVVAAGGDHFKVVRDPDTHNWDLLVNDKYVMMVTAPTIKYSFGSTNPATLSLYEKSHHGVLRPDEVILFSTWSPGDRDSGLLGVVSVSDLIGKVDLDDAGPSKVQ